jgi:hypothetical protein
MDERVELDNNSTKVDNENDELSCSEEPNRSDTIYRQNAIDAIRAMQTYKLGAGDDMLLIDQAEAQTELMMLPTAQQEIIHCRDCKHWTNNIGDSELRDNYCDEEVHHGFYYRCSGDDYYSYAERKTNDECR